MEPKVLTHQEAMAALTEGMRQTAAAICRFGDCLAESIRRQQQRQRDFERVLLASRRRSQFR